MKKSCAIVSLLVASARAAPQDLRSEPILNEDCEDLALGWVHLNKTANLAFLGRGWEEITLNKVNIAMINVSKL